MLSEIGQMTTEQIEQELRRTFAPPSAGGRPFPGSSPRVGAVEAWLDLRRGTDDPTRRKIDGAILQGLAAALSKTATHPEVEVMCAHARILRLAAKETPGLQEVTDDAKKAILGAIRSDRYKGVQTSYGDAHAELLACVEAFRLAPDYNFWLIQMHDAKFVTQAVSGCLGSDSEHWALSGVIQAAKLGDSSLALALMRLFRMFAGRESVVWDRFAEARRIDTWKQEVFDQVSRFLAQIGQSCPSDAALALEEDVVRLQEKLWIAQANEHYTRAEKHVTALCLEDSVRELDEAARILEPCVVDPRASDACKRYREAVDALHYLIERRTRFAAAESDPHRQLRSLVNWSFPACRGNQYEHVLLYRRACARSFSELINAITLECPPPESKKWRVARTAVGHFGELAASEEHRPDPDDNVLDIARQTFHQVAASLRQNRHAEPGFFAFAVLGTLLLFEDVNPTEWPIARRHDVAESAKRLQRAKEHLHGTAIGEIEKAWKLDV